MKHIIFSFFAAIVLFVPAAVAQIDVAPEATPPVVGAWNIVYTLGPATVTRQVKVVAYSDHTAKYILGARATTNANTEVKAVWDDPPGGMFNFSGEVRIPLGNVGVDTGTLIFKSFAGNANLLNCQVIYVQYIPFVASTVNYVIKTGSCVANPINPPTP
jgi:hypothetical protein